MAVAETPEFFGGRDGAAARDAAHDDLTERSTPEMCRGDAEWQRPVIAAAVEQRAADGALVAGDLGTDVHEQSPGPRRRWAAAAEIGIGIGIGMVDGRVVMTNAS